MLDLSIKPPIDPLIIFKNSADASRLKQLESPAVEKFWSEVTEYYFHESSFVISPSIGEDESSHQLAHFKGEYLSKLKVDSNIT